MLNFSESSYHFILVPSQPQSAIQVSVNVPGLKNSVTLEPYQPLQLDIGAANVKTIADALRGLTRPETLQGDFHSPRGPGTTATKQLFIETLPPVLILHLKRFQYDNTGGTQKIWKRVGYPLELEIPKDVLPPAKRSGLGVHGGAPRYRLVGVVYHHGKNASVGHYSVDVRRQDGREWIRIDDTIIRRIRSDDVAEAAAEDEVKSPSSIPTDDQGRRAATKSRALFDFVAGSDAYVNGDDGDHDDDDTGRGATGGDDGWKEVNGHANGGHVAKKSINGVNGVAKPATKTAPKDRTGLKDNKVAYILFYQQIR